MCVSVRIKKKDTYLWWKLRMKRAGCKKGKWCSHSWTLEIFMAGEGCQKRWKVTRKDLQSRLSLFCQSSKRWSRRCRNSTLLRFLSVFADTYCCWMFWELLSAALPSCFLFKRNLPIAYSLSSKQNLLSTFLNILPLFFFPKSKTIHTLTFYSWTTDCSFPILLRPSRKYCMCINKKRWWKKPHFF